MLGKGGGARLCFSNTSSKSSCHSKIHRIKALTRVTVSLQVAFIAFAHAIWPELVTAPPQFKKNYGNPILAGAQKIKRQVFEELFVNASHRKIPVIKTSVSHGCVPRQIYMSYACLHEYSCERSMCLAGDSL